MEKVRGVGRRIFKYILRKWKLLIAVASLNVIGAILSVYVPYVSRLAINDIVYGDVSSLWFYAIVIVSFTVGHGLINFVSRYYSEFLAQSVIYEIRNDVYRRIQNLSYGFFHRINTGQLVARVTSDVNQVRRFIIQLVSGFLGSLITFISAFAMMLSLNVELTLISMIIAPIVYSFVKFLVPRLRSFFIRARETYGDITSLIQEATTGIKLIKALTVERAFEEKFLTLNERYLDSMLGVARYRAIFWPTLTLVTSLITLLVYWYGGLKALGGQITIGDIVAFSLYINMLIWPLMWIGFIVISYQRACVAASRVFEIMDVEPEVKESPNARDIRIERGHVVFENVWFSYDGKHWILRGLNLEVRPGEVVAIVGPTGSGKTTLAHLIMRFYDPQKGRILIDGVDVRSFKIDSLRRQIGIVHQDIFLFSDTIRNNIAYGKPEATMEEVMEAAKLAYIHDFISSLPQGYETRIGERGVTLSGGQRQRLAIARALITNPRIIILDDPTSNVDYETEKAIYDALTRHFRGKTVIVITQRLSTLRLVDRIIVLDKGKVVEEGSHEELLKKGGLYAKLYRLVFSRE